MADFEKRIEALNRPQVRLDATDTIKIGWEKIAEFMAESAMTSMAGKKNQACLIAFDGYVGTDWSAAIDQLKKTFVQKKINSIFINIETCLKSEAEIKELLNPFLGDDPVLGRLYKKGLKSLFDPIKLKELNATLRKLRKERPQEVIVCYGTGAAMNPLRPYYDRIIFADLTRQEVLKRNKSWTKLAGKTQSISPKKLYYVDFQVNDRHRNQSMRWLDFYIDGNRSDQPVLMPLSTLEKITAALAGQPFRLKPIYEPGPWGGQWLKKIRRLPAEWVNCAWSYEVIAQEMSLMVAVDQSIIELPWTTFFGLQYDRVIGDVPKKRFAGEFPIRYDYLDTMDGGDLSIQVHPTTPYIRNNFGEPYHQGEMYYIVAAKNDTSVNLGLNEATKAANFFEVARLADEKGIPFNYQDFVNSVPSKPHDLLLIPPGTVHGSGKGQVVLEISATTYRYTFKIYDHLRPDLNGVMRPIHVRHAFNVIEWFRRSNWVARNLKQEPRRVRNGNGWAEYVIADRREFFHVVFRLEFDREIEDDTNGKFHILTLVEGDSVSIQSLENAMPNFMLNYSETLIVPSCLGAYRMMNMGKCPCKIVKAKLR